MNIPDELLHAPEYLKLFASERMFMIDLYVLFGDCDRFSVNMDRPQDYRQMPGAHLGRKLQSLLDSGLIVIDGKTPTRNQHYRRVFRFKFPVLEYA